MIDLYYWPTPNGWKISIFLEEAGLAYNTIPVNIGKGDQFDPEFLKIGPNNRMPVIVDHDGPGGKTVSLMESGAILIYLAEKTGKFLPDDPLKRYDVLQWLMWQMGGIGPMCGQAHHFRQYAPEKIEYGIDRYTNEVGRLYRVLDKQLQGEEYVCGDYSIADMAIYPWVILYERQGQTLEDTPDLKRWMGTMKARPAVRAGIDHKKEWRRPPGEMDEETRSVMFGAKQFAKR
ncbi:MAG: glutathione S-transferase N-terminal domain-containing protein [Minwuiales bacterium]|nr:glutathione S-transferase N-terminal domain-containing protein [Minwuiales bacterium]